MVSHCSAHHHTLLTGLQAKQCGYGITRFYTWTIWSMDLKSKSQSLTCWGSTCDNVVCAVCTCQQEGFWVRLRHLWVGCECSPCTCVGSLLVTNPDANPECWLWVCPYSHSVCVCVFVGLLLVPCSWKTLPSPSDGWDWLQPPLWPCMDNCYELVSLGYIVRKRL